jgi:hypothetical protein
MHIMKYFFESISAPLNTCTATQSLRGYSIYTSKEWIDFILKNTKGNFVGVKISSSEGHLGYFYGVQFKRFGLNIVGSPFRGWGTSYMGVLGDIANDDLMWTQLLDFIHRTHAAHYIEIVDRRYQSSNIVESKNFETECIESLEIALQHTEAELLSSFKGDCRTYIRQFDAKGGVIKISEPSESFINLFYGQLLEVFGRQGMQPTYSKNRVQDLFHTLTSGSKDYLCLSAFGPNGECIASSIYFGENGTFYYWAGASYRGTQSYRPNEAMIWFAIRHFKALGYRSFDMMGVRDYKLKFSPTLINYTRISSSKIVGLKTMRNIAEKSYYLLNKARTYIQNPVWTRKSMQLSSMLAVQDVLNFEIAHYDSAALKIFSKFNTVTFFENEDKKEIKLPLPIVKKILGKSRLVRRLLRLDKCCVIPTATGHVFFWQGAVYHLSPIENLVKTLTLISSRNPMHNCVAQLDSRTLIFGEYGNPHPNGKNIYRTEDGGLNWSVVYNFSCDDIRHVHNCSWDHSSQRLWIFTGDFNGQCKVISTDPNFQDIRTYGDGSQIYRATGAFFEKNYVHWIMDSPLDEVRHVRLDKKTGEIKIGQSFPGPVYYYLSCTDGVYLVCTVQEIGPSHKDKFLHVYASRNLKKWTEVARFEHDRFPKRFFKFGVGAFADGAQTSEDFVMHFEAVKGFDGKVVRLSLKGI